VNTHRSISWLQTRTRTRNHVPPRARRGRRPPDSPAGPYPQSCTSRPGGQPIPRAPATLPARPARHWLSPPFAIANLDDYDS
jgi:hypothetical protein